jgi:hypothetical protein
MSKRSNEPSQVGEGSNLLSNKSFISRNEVGFLFLVAVLVHWGCACADMNGLDLRQATVHVHHINNSNAMLDAAAEDGRPAHWTVYLDAYCAEPKKRRQQLCKMDWRRDGANPCFFSHKGGGVHCLPL